MKYLGFISIVLLVVISLISCGGNQPANFAVELEGDFGGGMQADVLASEKRPTKDANYDAVDKILADISVEMSQPNILKEDILRGWYMAGKNEKKYGTPDTWVFVEDGARSKWISLNAMDEGELIDDRQLCRQTAGTYVPSCLQTSESDCDYVEKSYCNCLSGSQWKDTQGCILVTERGNYVSINNAELQQGWYLGLPNEKKLNTPSDWTWLEKGPSSLWQKVN